VPLAVKLAPDLSDAELAAAAEAIAKHDVSAVIATNTTTGRAAVHGLPHADEKGGLSGAPLREVSTRMISELRRLLPTNIAIIGVGGIFGVEDARTKLRAGADLVQVYTGLVYRGPGLVRELVAGLAGFEAKK